MSNRLPRAAALVAALCLAAGVALAEKTQHKDSLKGYDTKSYTVAAKAGQTLTVFLKSNSSFLYFNVTPAGADEAIWIGTVQGREKAFVQKLDKDGEFEIDLYLQRAEARRQGRADYTLTVSLD